MLPGDPPAAARSDVTGLLHAWQQGDRAAFDRLVPLVYDELRGLARAQLRRDAGQWTLQATALVHEAYVRLAGTDVSWENSSHFFAIAARVMRQVLVDEARRRQAEKRGGGVRPVDLAPDLLGAVSAGEPETEADFLALDQALTRLAELDARRAEVVELRYFAGMTIEETSRHLGFSHATVERDLKLARAWLSRQLRRGA
ncbi:MAG TPA: RNA polymerase subunit sigma-70 [Acidobacteria bacterium]|nr:RNA polymerase subunit sigma-70 [Acidobacteriota bacterium]